MNEITKTTGSFLAGVDLKDILSKYYGKSNVTMKRQMGWFDVTFLVVDHDQNDERFIFKVFIDIFTATQEQIEAEITMIKFLKDRHLPVPTVIETLDGASYGESDFVDEEKGRHTKRFRLQTFIEGNILHRQLSVDICKQIGDLAGRVDVALSSFQNEYYDKGDPNFLVNFSDDVNIFDLIQNLPDEHQRVLASKYAELYKEKVGSRLNELPQQQIHCDMHGSNLIVNEDASTIVGLIDFSDARNTIRVLEPAIGLGSILMFAPDKLKCAQAFMEAYENHIQLLPIEKESLIVVTMGRMIQGLVINQHFAMTVPNFNANYLGAIYGPGWPMVEKLLTLGTPEKEFFEKFAKS